MSIDKKVAGAVLAVIAAAGLVVARRRRSTPAGRSAERGPFRCECGQELRVSGVDRHRVFWLPDADASDPIMGDKCPNCERSLLAQQG